MAERHFTDGSLLGMREMHEAAIAEYRKALQFDSARGAIYYAIGKSFRELNEIDSAIHYARLADDRAGPSTELLADLLVVAGDIEGAIVQYDSMLARDKNQLQARYMVARLLQRREPEKAVAHYEYILRNIVDDVDVMLRLAELYLDLGNVDGALGMMNRMIALEPTNGELHRMSITILLDSRRYSEAVALLRAAESRLPAGSPLDIFLLESLRDVDDRLSRGPSLNDSLNAFARELIARVGALSRSSSVRSHGGSIALLIGDGARAETLFARALEDSTASAQTWMHIAGAYLETEEATSGLRVTMPHVRRFIDDHRVSYLAGMLHTTGGNNDSAVAWMRRSLETYEQNADAWSALARLYIRTGQADASDAAFERSIAIASENRSVLSDYAEALASRGSRLDRAHELIELALAIEPENESYLSTRGWIRFQRGELDAATADLERAVAIGGANAQVYERLGDVLAARGERSSAHSAYEHAQRIEPGRTGIGAKLDNKK